MKMADKREKAKKRLQQLVSDGLDSGPAKLTSKSDWGDMDGVASLDQQVQTSLRAQAARRLAALGGAAPGIQDVPRERSTDQESQDASFDASQPDSSV